MNGMPPRSADQQIWVPDDARRQAGVFTRRQAVAAGATADQVRWRMRTGLWVPVVGSVLRAASTVLDEWSDLFCARLTWHDSIVVLGTAARVHRLPVARDGRIHVVVPHGRARRGPLTPHQFRLDDADVVEIMGVPVTSRRRTILDCLGRLDADASLSLLAWVSSRRLIAPDELRAWVARHPGRWGNPARRSAAMRLASGAVSPAEDRLHEILRRAGITGWLAGVSLEESLGVRAQADVYFPDVRLVIEVEGRRAHGGSRFQSDRTRQNLLVAAGCTILRYTWEDLASRPDEVAAQIRDMLIRLRGAVL